MSLVKSPRLGSTPRLTDWLTVRRKVTLALALVDRLCGLMVRVPGYRSGALSLTPGLDFSFMSTPSLHYPPPILQKSVLNFLRSWWGEFLNLPNPSGRTTPWGLLSLYQKCVLNLKIIMFLGSKVRRVRRADSLTAIWADCLDNVGSLTSRNSIGIQGLLRR
jgi:hypothetical protein